MSRSFFVQKEKKVFLLLLRKSCFIDLSLVLASSSSASEHLAHTSD